MLITNAKIINEGKTLEGDVLIKNGRIEKIAGTISAPADTEIWDARGKLLIPGMIDDQVHFREPGLTHKGNLATESAAAVAGGITSVMEMPNTIPNCVTRSELAAKYLLARGRTHTNYAFYFGGANDNIEEIKALEPGESCGIKVFMGASTGNMLVDNPETLDAIFRHAQTIIITHCEDTPTIQRNEAAARAKWGEDVPWAQHPIIRSAEACYLSSKLAIGLAKKHNSNLHVLHLTTARELEFFTPGPVKGKRITVEACVHHLSMNDSLYALRGSQVKCNPAIKTEADRAALVKAVREDRIDIVATDHAPHTWEEKQQGFWKAPSGLPLVQHALPMLMDLVKRGELDLPTLVRKTSHAIADRFGLRERGYIREGYFADLTLINPDAPWIVDRSNILYKCGWSPLEGETLPAKIEATWVNGELAYAHGKVQAKPLGQRLQFA